MKKLSLLAITLCMMVASSVYALAGTCEVKYTRTACPGKEAISYKKCKGKKVCSKYKEADTIEACKVLAVKSCSNRRLTVTKSKIIQAAFNGETLQTSAGSNDFCTTYDKVDTEFNRCDG